MMELFITVMIKTMGEKDKLIAKLEKLLKDYENGHRRLKKMKDDMRLLREKIAKVPKTVISTREDELQLKGEM